jgi:hypothetical protein
MKHVQFLLYREMGTIGFLDELWPLYRLIRLQGKALTFDFQHLFGTPAITTNAEKKKKEGWGLTHELMDGSFESIMKIVDLYDVHLQLAQKELTNPNARVFTMSVDGVVCDGSILVGDNRQVHGVMPGSVADVSSHDRAAMRADPAKMREFLESTSEFAVGALNIAALTPWAPDAPVFPIAAMPAVTTAINEDHMKEFFDRVVRNMDHALAIINARPEVAAKGRDNRFRGGPRETAEVALRVHRGHREVELR